MGKTPTPLSTTTSSPSSPSTTTTSSPTLVNFPSLGDAFPSRELLSSIIKGNGKALGYIFKCSVTSEHRVTYYCSNKYHAPRCMAGFKAAYTVRDKEWVVTEATEHNEGCTKLRQRVNGSNGIKTEGKSTIPLPFKPASAVVSKDHHKGNSAPAVNSSSNHKTRNSFSSFRNPISSSNEATSSFNHDNASGDRQVANNRKNRAYSTSTTGTSAPSTSPPSSIINARRSSLNYGNRRALREVDENEALQKSDEGDSLPFNSCGDAKSTNSKKTSHNVRQERRGNEGKSRDRSSSSSSTQSSERFHVTTILDPEFHFPTAALEASIKLQKTLPCRRKRSSSYVRNSAVLLGRYLESQNGPKSTATDAATIAGGGGDKMPEHKDSKAVNLQDETMSPGSSD